MPQPIELIVGIAGNSGSGKSTLAKALGLALGGETASFGDFIRHIALVEGRSLRREDLQEIGQALVERDPEEFVASFLKWRNPDPSKPLVLDGVRHLSVDGVIRVWANSQGRRYVSVLVSAPLHVRAARRANGDSSQLAKADLHPVEREAAQLSNGIADFVLDGTGDATLLAKTLAEELLRTDNSRRNSSK